MARVSGLYSIFSDVGMDMHRCEFPMTCYIRLSLQIKGHGYAFLISRIIDLDLDNNHQSLLDITVMRRVCTTDIVTSPRQSTGF